MHHRTLFALVLCVLTCAAGCGKDEKASPTTEVAPLTTGETTAPVSEVLVDVDALVEKIGAEPGAFAIDKDVGSEGVVTARSGTVALRRAGEEAFQEIKENNRKLYTGDQVRTSADSSAVLTLADESVVELAEFTTVAVGDRDTAADPASSVAVMAGVARFSVSERGQGEGAFLVFTSAGIVGAKGTTYAVGVAATGDMRVGVEDGEVEVAGGAALEAPIVVSAGHKVDLSEQGKVGKVVEFTADDWGQWRDTLEAEATAEAMAKAHIKAVQKLELEIGRGYRDLEAQAKAVVEAEAMVLEAEKSGDEKAYMVAAPELAATVEASYLASARLEFLTYAMLSRSYIATELYVRHPEVVAPVFVPAAPHIYGSILYQKKFHEVVHVHARPWRAQYYSHHPHGRVQAIAVGYEVPAFYVKHKLKPLPPGAVRGKLKVEMYARPTVVRFNVKKKVWVGPPIVGWASHVKVGPHKARAEVGWYVKVEQPRAKFWGAKAHADKEKAVFGPGKPKKRGSAGAHIGIGHPGKHKHGASKGADKPTGKYDKDKKNKKNERHEEKSRKEGKYKSDKKESKGKDKGKDLSSDKKKSKGKDKGGKKG